MDAVYVVRAGYNEELRYSLRSLTNLPHDQVWVVGNPPSWVRGVNVVRAPRIGDKWTNAWRNWRAALDADGLSDEFMLMNDDFFVMRPVKSVPVWHRGALFTDANKHAANGVLSNYGRALLRTRELLAAEGVKSPLSYELHMPMVVDKAGYGKALEAKVDDMRLCERSIYGNRAGVGGQKHDDVKVYGDSDPIPDAAFVSTTDSSFRFGQVGRLLRRAFPTPGPYEVSR